MESTYWKKRKHLKYYKAAVRLAKMVAPRAETTIDVGSANTKLLESVDWVPKKFALDRRFRDRPCQATYIRCDFVEFKCDREFDLVFCLQVLEHSSSPRPFAKKLLSIGGIIIVSVPYKWRQGMCKDHVQDPVDEAKLVSWMEAPFFYSEVVVEKNGVKRLLAAFRGCKG